MTRRTLVVRRNGWLREPRDAGRLLQRLVAEPGVESVRIETAPLCVVLRVAPELADEPSLRGLVQAQKLEREEHDGRSAAPAAQRPWWRRGALT